MYLNKTNFFFSLIEDYCAFKGIKRQKFAFVINKREFFEHDTPTSLEIKNGDEFEVIER